MPRQHVLLILKKAAWAPVLVVVLHTTLARLFGHEPYVDPAVHLLGGSAIAFFVRKAAELSPRLMGAPSQTALDALAVGGACVAAVLWELAELLSDVVLGTNIQRSAPNTLRDLALGLGGAILFVAARQSLSRRSAAPP